ncbi:glycogen synthase GlgA [Alphaproteobacteria bacterium GH1-50]|uniref:Glycogen synthase n=1 Tax=Kangsaoukella pontilimi TaxID=2691042 RepID=A0A7C9IHY1_9RHOB|nr:glycogen synthase GlgA [Kangsaoukella pontilimi]MXQ09408.1 glycogen synthase GlgA [Kangsaoukella pontilimi]
MRTALSVTSECAPLVKTGGLADVAGALPGAMAPLGWDIRTLLPGYPRVMEQAKRSKAVADIPDLFGGDAAVLKARVAGLDLYILDAPHLYDRPGTPYLDDQGYDYWDNPERFAALCWVAAEIAENGIEGWKPELLHCHDWQAGLAPYYLMKRDRPVPSLITIHNIAFQGLAPADRMGALRLDGVDFNADGIEYWGQVSALKAGLVYSDRITTVSPTYARELMTHEFGMGMEGLLQARAGDLSGILNGIDLDVWNPATDPEIATFKTARGKSRAKSRLQKEMGLAKSDGPLAVVISRLSHQKGLDLLLEALPAFLDRGGQLALLGSGDKGLERAFAEAAGHPNVAVRIGYDEALSHRMMAGGDAILVPSRFEPCGLTQLYGLRYGTIPVVAMTGGLVDTVINASPMALRSGVATGLQFGPITAHAMAGALMRLTELYAEPETWAQLQANAMRQEVGWNASAAEYAALYQEVAEPS